MRRQVKNTKKKTCYRQGARCPRRTNAPRQTRTNRTTLKVGNARKQAVAQTKADPVRTSATPRHRCAPVSTPNISILQRRLHASVRAKGAGGGILRAPACFPPSWEARSRLRHTGNRVTEVGCYIFVCTTCHRQQAAVPWASPNGVPPPCAAQVCQYFREIVPYPRGSEQSVENPLRARLLPPLQREQPQMPGHVLLQRPFLVLPLVPAIGKKGEALACSSLGTPNRQGKERKFKSCVRETGFHR